MHIVTRSWLLIVLMVALASYTMRAREIRSRHYKFSIDIPETMNKVADTSANEGDIYYDTSAKIVLMISQRKSNFHSVEDYLDCTKRQLEEQLRYFYADSSLHLVNCARAPYYPKKSTVVLFHVSVLPYGFNTCLVYFVHHRHRDLQFAFTYKDTGTPPDKYITAIMQSLKLR